MSKKTLQEVWKEYQSLGFERSLFEAAYAAVKGDTTRIMDEIFRLQKNADKYSSTQQKINAVRTQIVTQSSIKEPMDDDAQLNKAIEESMQEAKIKDYTFQPLNPEQRVRKSGVAVGLKNVGNTCYFNSLLQTYFHNAEFVRTIFRYTFPLKYSQLPKNELKELCNTDSDFKRKYMSCKMVQELKELFALLIGSDRKYVDPSAVLACLVDEFANKVAIGEQKDIGEFNLLFLSRVDDGLEEERKETAMDVEGKDPPSPLYKSMMQLHNQTSIMERTASELSPSRNMIDSQCLIRKTSIRVSEGSALYKQFVGKLENSFENESQKVHHKEEQLFNMLLANVRHRELYRACQQLVMSQIDDYRNEQGEIISVKKQSWICVPPRTLFFQVGRFAYDKEAQSLCKLHDPFDFPKQFYIDSFLLKNKQQALQLQQQVQKLRQSKDQCSNALESIRNYNSTGLGLIEVITNAAAFLTSQTSTHKEQESLLPLPITTRIKCDHITLLQDSCKAVQNKKTELQSKVRDIDQRIAHAYSKIRSEPYVLYSILIHEGSAESGHYYAYVLDAQKGVWRKCNDINVSEEGEEGLLREARGQGQRSAYYLVYAQRKMLVPSDQGPLCSHLLSSDPDYGKDFYFSLFSLDLHKLVRNDNLALHLEIEQYRIKAFVTRVVQAYCLRFEACNENFRLHKPESKKHNPPYLINYPLFVKQISVQEYKNVLIAHCIQELGPKQQNKLFEQQLRRKLTGLNEFKRPKRLDGNARLQKQFLENVHWTSAARRLYECVQNKEYSCLCGLIDQLLKAPSDSFFEWMANLFVKLLVLLLFLEAEKAPPSSALPLFRLAAFFLLTYVNTTQEHALHTNCFFWLAEKAVDYEGTYKNQLELLSESVSNKVKGKEFAQIQASRQNQNIFGEIAKTIDAKDVMWNLSRQENVCLLYMNQARENVKNVLEPPTNLYKEIKKNGKCLDKKERLQFIK